MKLRRIIPVLLLITLTIAVLSIVISIADSESFESDEYMSLYYQPRRNLQVGINFNVELMQIAAAHSAGFEHKGYVTGNSRINGIVKDYFKRFPIKEYEKDLQLQSVDGVVNKLYHGETDYILCMDKKFERMIFKTGRPDLFADRGQVRNKDMLVSVIKDFGSYSKAETFFNDNKKIYSGILENFRAQYDFDYIKNLEELTGINTDSSEFKLIISPSMSGGMAVSLKDAGGREVLVNITNPSEDYGDTLHTLYHEGIHNFLVPVLMKSWSEYDNNRFNGCFNQNVGDGGNAFNETVTRALTNIALEQYHPEVDTKHLMELYLKTGWINTDKVYYLLINEYLNSRDRYKTIEDFLPRILRYFDERRMDLAA